MLYCAIISDYVAIFIMPLNMLTVIKISVLSFLFFKGAHAEIYQF